MSVSTHPASPRIKPPADTYAQQTAQVAGSRVPAGQGYTATNRAASAAARGYKSSAIGRAVFVEAFALRVPGDRDRPVV
jgi:hypothetical protein